MIIDELSATISDNLTDEVPVEQGQLTFKTTWQKILNLFLPQLHLEDYLRKDGTTAVRWNSSSYDLNDLVTGVVYASTRVQNTPEPASTYLGEYLIVGAGSSSERVQIAIPWTTNISANIFPQIRYLQSESWTVWVAMPFLLKKGGTMTGNLLMDNKEIDLKSSNIWSNINYDTQVDGNAQISLLDYDGDEIGYIHNRFYPTNHREALRIASKRLINNADVENELVIGVEDDGTKWVNLDQDSWLSALGLLNTSSTTTASSVATAASGFSITSASFRKWGKLAQIAITVERTGSSISSEQAVDVCTLVSGKRPVDTVTIPPSNTQLMYGTVNSSGLCTLRVTAWAKNNSKAFRAMYLLP